MATVTKTFVFIGNSEGLAEVGLSTRTRFYFTGANGSPAVGSIEFDNSGYTSFNEVEAARSSSASSWEALFGVPSGATVTDVQVTAWKYYWNTGGWPVTGPVVKMQIQDSSNTTVHSAGLLIDASIATDGAWYSGSAGTSRAVDASYQASTTNVKLYISSSSGSANDGEGPLLSACYLDTIEITVTYTPAAAAGNPYYYYRSQ